MNRWTASPFVADLYRWWYSRRGIIGRDLLVETFLLQDLLLTLRLGAVPLWTAFNTDPDLETAQRYIGSREPFARVSALLLSHGVESIGLPTGRDWEQLTHSGRSAGPLLGADPEQFPRDFAGAGRYHRALRRLPQRHPLPSPLPPRLLNEFLEQNGSRYSLRWEESVSRRTSSGAERRRVTRKSEAAPTSAMTPTTGHMIG